MTLGIGGMYSQDAELQLVSLFFWRQFECCSPLTIGLFFLLPRLCQERGGSMICRGCFSLFVHCSQSPFGRWDVVKLQGAPCQGQRIVSRIRLELRSFAPPFESRPITGT